MMLKISEITVGLRARRDMGDLAGLAASIAAHGLLQPIGVSKNRELIFGERRLRACRDVLGWDKIKAEVLDIEAIAFGEHDENMLRKEFAPTERVRIAEKIRETITERRGRPLNPIEGIALPATGLPKGIETREIVAKKAGFSGAFLYEAAKNVEAHGVQELIQMMDTGEVSISAAAVVAKRSAEEQMEIVSQGAAAVARHAASFRQAKRAKKRKGKGKNKELRLISDRADDGRPPRLNRFYLSLRSVFDMINEIGKEPAEFLAYAAENRTVLDPQVSAKVASFVGDLVALMQADRAA